MQQPIPHTDPTKQHPKQIKTPAITNKIKIAPSKDPITIPAILPPFNFLLSSDESPSDEA